MTFASFWGYKTIIVTTYGPFFDIEIKLAITNSFILKCALLHVSPTLLPTSSLLTPAIQLRRLPFPFRHTTMASFNFWRKTQKIIINYTKCVYFSFYTSIY